MLDLAGEVWGNFSMTIRYRIACAYFVLLAVIFGFGLALAYLLFRLAFSRFLPLVLVLLMTASCAHQPPVIPVVPLEEIHLGESIGPHVLLCLESPDEMVTRHRWVCLRMEAVRRYFAQARVAD